MNPFQIRADPGEVGDEYVAVGAWGRYNAAGILVRHLDDNGVVRYLLAKGAPGMSQEKWALPGGALHSLETPAQGAAREMSEELGVDQAYLDSLDLIGIYVAAKPNGWHYTTFATSVAERCTPVADTHEVVAARWIAEDELRTMAANGELHSALTQHLEAILELYESQNRDRSDEPQTLAVQSVRGRRRACAAGESRPTEGTKDPGRTSIR
ncbi:NUDIX hydrolase [Nocardia brasiliensis]|uniref:NUDIX hydrolase n=1 Tax=Nocardia brasiliensis TaxID=37326 RepID=UPI002457EA75|nr:NUDIX hydrolase [Nocardia brasiliensis]